MRLGPVVVNNVDGLGGDDVPDPARRRPRAAVARRRRCSPPRRRSAAAAWRCSATRSPGSARELALEQWHLPMLPVAGLDAGDVDRARRVDAGGARDAGSTPRSAAPQVVVCCGSGGVGKTTTAAVIGLEAARAGRRAVVVTIDPARRLADALGLPDGLAAEPQRIDLDAPRRAVGDDARHRAPRSTASCAATPPTRRRPSGSWPTASTATSPAPSAARRSTWRPRRCTSCTATSASTSSSSTRRRAATPSTSSRRRACSPASSTTGCSSC